MVFASLTFIYIFLPVFFIIYYLFKKNIHAQNIIICIFSLLFYAWGEPIYIFLLIGSILANFFVGIAIDNKKFIHRKRYFIFGIVFNILLLFVFKYINLLFDIFGILKIRCNNVVIPLPIGISFYTFQALSYIIDVYNGKVKAQKKFVNLVLYISMFPQLIAGPIVRYTDIEKNIEKRVVTYDIVYMGLCRVIIGLSKKIILANQLSSIVNVLLANNKSIIGGFSGIILFVIELYFDFSGYSDVAIGIGRILGFTFLENFDHPFMAISMTEFWRKWHISLSNFFRDYVYIPLGGNKKNKYFNIFFVWFLTGVWHGATVNFLFWGVFLGAVICIEKYFFEVYYKMPKNKIISSIVGHIYLIIITFFSFTLFYFEDIGALKNFLYSFSVVGFLDYESMSIIINNFNLIIISIICLFPLVKIYKHAYDKLKNNILLFTLYNYCSLFFIILFLIIDTLLLIGGINNPFLYFRF